MSLVRETTGLLVDIQTGAVPRATVLAVAMTAFIGAIIIVGVGFAGPEVLHNAAHDLRHGLAFPCH